MKQLLPILLLSLVSYLPARADQFVNGQAADVVLGQPDFETSGPTNRPERFSTSAGVARDPATGKVFVADSNHHRVLRFSNMAAAMSHSDPEAVFGQPNFTSYLSNQGGSVGQNTLNFPFDLFVDQRGRLWVADYSNHRVLGFFAASYRGSNPNADYVFGQPDFETNTSGVSVTKMYNPTGVWVDSDDILWVADFRNNRVLRYDDISYKSSSDDADVVLGQSNFNLRIGDLSQSGMDGPYSIAVDAAGRLWVGESENCRITRFDNAADKMSGALADGLLFQPDFTTANLLPAAANTIRRPADLLPAADGTLWVADDMFRRVVGVADAAAQPVGVSATKVLGKPNFTAGSGDLGARNIFSPTGLSHGPRGSLFVADSAYSRVLRFSPFKTPTIRFTRARAVSRRPVYTTRGRATQVVTRVRFRVGGSAYRNAQGTNAWRARLRLRPGRNVVFAYAEGPGGDSKITRQFVTYKAPRNRLRARAKARAARR